MDDETLGVVLDIGSANLRAGFAGDDAPRAMLPSVLGRPRHRTNSQMNSLASHAYFPSVK